MFWLDRDRWSSELGVLTLEEEILCSELEAFCSEFEVCCSEL